MRIWIDLSNSPHVLFFIPIIHELERQGYSIMVTARDFAQTIQLAEKFGLRYSLIGRHGGKSAFRKGLNLISNGLFLMKWAKNMSIDLAVSHNSYRQSLAAFLAGIPSITTMDYEYQPANHLSFRLAKRVIVPEFFPEDALKHFGAKPNKVKKYPGLKENVYLSYFTPDVNFLANLGLDDKKIIVTVRPPATFALYHRFENPLFDELMQWLLEQNNIFIIFLPRISEQKDIFLKNNYSNVFVPPQALDGPNLLFYSDLVISAGGTMNREAAVLGTPVYTIFAGRIPAVDSYLINTGKMIRIENRKGFDRIKVCKKLTGNFKPKDDVSLKTIVDLITNLRG